MLTPEQLENLKLWLAQQDTSPICPSCGREEKWQPGDVLVLPIWEGQPIEYPKGLPPGAQASLACVTLSCSHCGFMKFYSARQIGLI